LKLHYCTVRKMVAELRKNGKRWVLYTNDVSIYKHLRKNTFTTNKVPYIKNGKIVGIDFYFEKKSIRTMRRISKGQLLLGI
jgi:hypothetical protein